MKIVPHSISVNVENPKNISPVFKKTLATCLKKSGSPLLSDQLVHDLLTAMTEGVANAIRHAGELSMRGAVNCVFKITQNYLEIHIADHGPGFDLKKIKTPDFKNLSGSGRGIFMMRQLMDVVLYKKQRTKNILVLKRNLVGMDKNSRNLDLLYEISHAILAGSDLNSVYQIILEKAAGVFGAEKASIMMFDPRDKKLKIVASLGLEPKIEKKIRLEPGEGIAGYVFQHAKPCLIENMAANQSGWEKRKKYKSQSFISAPMIRSPMQKKVESVGVINMTDRIGGRRFSKKDLKLLTTIANQATAYLHLCQLVAGAKDAELLRRELDIARHIQQGYLPNQPPPIEGIKLCGWLETAEAVGGDYYDFIQTEKNSLFVVIADVSGHNVAAALTMIHFRSQLRSVVNQEQDPGRILTLLNQNIYQDLVKNDQLITVLLLKLDFLQKKTCLANAGHPMPLLASLGEPLIDQNKSGTPLGVVPAEIYATENSRFLQEETLVLFTDGLIEAKNPRGQRFGHERLKHHLKNNAGKNADSLCQSLKKEIKTFCGSGTPSDDITAVVINFL